MKNPSRLKPRPLLAAALLATASLAASAQTKQEPASPGVYLGVQVARVSGPQLQPGSHGGPGVSLGYRVNAGLAVEVFGRDLCGLFCSLFNGLKGKDYVEPSEHLGLAALGFVPLGAEGWQAYGRLGLGRTSFERGPGSPHAAHQTEASLGGGIAYDFSPRFGLKLEALRYTRTRLNSVSLGGEWRF
ncbi:outer membrane beta-barrel protein [Pelomonas sp. SE-A7]|uniref:outer membrane beta-barrel protein n=1 Tax=Pelomonas sp. SE-A7 TaxID=3054953 RepID=UPI00259D2C9B|nr:outer membrane beta-barrel protein [Pelomonas sp. SE-A7]MDM4768417.1 outer membrane beta-barrel protein [Pelomonas sp. SE-A7]